ncbi:glycosyltransferase involved in cell wall biosynthesis [Halospina denitrificans]|uniref:Glycosyltransferase involved in cell wall biosynthesis n=1 Tax=Halospina denitrificans TaxID=332522 RepID=A0A4R7JYZ1_9GAMM|nr:glycosyltransferase family 4 protein [Halospina denitrificans]TDT43445.1 glycosyltransferase involved in cell wall biosynthesis [Halospina denitrificans]
MRILHFISAPAAGGAEIYVKDLSKYMSANGHLVTVVFLEHAAEIGRSKEFEKQFLYELAREGVTYEFLGHHVRRNPIQGGLKFRDIVSRFGPDITHIHLYYGLVFAAFSSSKCTVYTHHNIRLAVPWWFYRIFDLWTDHYVGICHVCTDKLKRVSGRQVSRIDNGVDWSRVNLDTNNSEKKCKTVKIVAVGSLVEQKNFELLLEALACNEDLEWELTILGEGTDEEQLSTRADQLGIGRRVKFPGAVSDVAEWYREADVFALSSVWEGLPISQIEALHAGLPMIVTNVGGCAEIIHRCCNGIVVDSLEVEEYANGLRKLIKDPEFRRALSENALKCSGAYSIEESVNKHLELYHELAGRGCAE